MGGKNKETRVKVLIKTNLCEISYQATNLLLDQMIINNFVSTDIPRYFNKDFL